MNNNFLLLVSLVLIMAKAADAQDSVTYTTLSLSIGLNSLSDKDAFHSPYTYRGTNLLLHSDFKRVGTKGEHVIDFTYSQGKIKSIVSPKANHTLLMLNYDYLFKLRNKTGDEKLTPSLGVGLHTFLSSANYLPSIENSVRYLSGSVYLTLTGNMLYRISKKSHVSIHAAFPALGVVYRPDYEVNGKTLTKITLPGNNLLFSTKLEYNYHLSRTISLIATYRYNYFTFDSPRSITILQNSLSLGLRKTF